jgi:hypothetical protein
MSRRRAALIFAAVAIATMVPYLQTVGHGFINLDDYNYRYNAAMDSGLCPETVEWAFADLEYGIWMPLTWCSFALDVSLFGGTPGGMHLHNVVIHGLCAGLLFLLLVSLLEVSGDGAAKQLANRQTVKPSTAAIAAALVALFWAWHPLRVESVAWVASRKDVLSFFFELLALLAWVGHLKCEDGREWFLQKRYWWSFLFFALATMAKPSAMTFPVIALLLDIFVVQAKNDGGKWNWRQYMPLLAYAAFIAVLAQRAQVAGGAVGTVGAPLWWRVVNAVASYGVYLYHTLWPTGMALQCACRWPRLPGHLAVGVVCVTAAGAFIVVHVLRLWPRLREFRRADDWVLAGVLIFTLAVGPFLGIASFGFHAYADRFTYVPSLGLCVLALGAASRLHGRALAAMRGLALLVLAALAACSWRQAAYWKDDNALYSRTLQVDGDRFGIVHNAMAVHFYEIEHNPDRVISEYEMMRDIDEGLATKNIGHLYILSLFETGRARKGFDEMLRYQRRIFEEMEKDRVSDGRAKQDVSVAFTMASSAQAIVRGEYDIAIGHIEQIDKVSPNYNYCRYLEGVMSLKQGHPEEALAAWRRIQPNYHDPCIRFRWLTGRLPADDAEALKILPSLAWKTPDDAEGPAK